MLYKIGAILLLMVSSAMAFTAYFVGAVGSGILWSADQIMVGAIHLLDYAEDLIDRRHAKRLGIVYSYTNVYNDVGDDPLRF